jgi:hypothetical protein
MVALSCAAAPPAIKKSAIAAEKSFKQCFIAHLAANNTLGNTREATGSSNKTGFHD